MPPESIRILHTSDWHLGRPIADIDRREDYAAFLNWLLGLMEARRPDLVLVSGDVFDTTMPSAEAQRLYYDFLARARDTGVKQVVVTAGNHDSQFFLRAARPVLEALGVFVAGSRTEEECFVLRSASGDPVLGVAAVPYLREGDVRSSRAGDREEERAAAWGRGVADHYEAARRRLVDLCGPEVPLVAMGHLFVTGSKTGSAPARAGADEGAPGAADGGGVYVGTVRNVSASVFGCGWAYVALGHIHKAQRVRAAVPVRYCGAPLALNVGDAGDPHQVVEVTLHPDGRIEEETIDVPQPRRLAALSGTLEELEAALDRLGAEAPGAVAEVLYTGEVTDAGSLLEALNAAAGRAGVRLSAVRCAVRGSAAGGEARVRSLDDITPQGVFDAVLADSAADDSVREELEELYAEILAEAQAAERDERAAADTARADIAEKADGKKE